jgi:hypothetical protein
MNWANQSIIPSDDIQDNQSTETNQSQSMKWRHNDLSRGSRACQHASPRCVPLHHVVRWLIGITHRASQSTRVGIRRSVGEPQPPLTTSSPEPATNNHRHVLDLHRCSKPSRWRQPLRETRIPQQKNTQVPTRCKLTSKCTWYHSISLWLGKQAREMSVRGCAQLKGVLEWSTSQELLQRADQHLFIDVPLRIEPLGNWFCCSRNDRTRW